LFNRVVKNCQNSTSCFKMINNTEDFFSGLVENRPSKIVTIFFTIIGLILFLLVVSAIIWYEKNGSDSKRPLNSRLFTACWFLLIIWYCIPLQIDLSRYIFGRLPKSVCIFSVFVKFFVTMNGILLVDISFLIRYLMIFWLKNPANFYDEFWSMFLISWASLVSAIFQVTLNILPGKDFPDIWICTGFNPKEDQQSEYKSTYYYSVFKFISITINVLIAIKIKIYKWKIEKENVNHHPRSKLYWLFSTNINSLFDLMESGIFLILISITLFIHAPRKQIELELLNEYPFYLSEYFYTLFRMVLTGLLLVCAKLASDKSSRKVLSHELINFASKFTCKKHI
jgi:hypothetical protein